LQGGRLDVSKKKRDGSIKLTQGGIEMIDWETSILMTWRDAVPAGMPDVMNGCWVPTVLAVGDEVATKFMHSLDFTEGMGCLRHGSTANSGARPGQKTWVGFNNLHQLLPVLRARQDYIQEGSDATVVHVVRVLILKAAECCICCL
jgi:hypothetical protein